MVVTVRRVLTLAALLAGVAHATTLLLLDLPALTRTSSAVVRGTVKSVSSRWTKDGGRIMTDAVLEVSETWKGTPLAQVTVMQPGGEVGDVGQLVHGTVKFKVGDEVVVFLEGRGGGDHFLLTGMAQGRFVVERSSDGRSIFARQLNDGEALFLDPTTHQPTAATSMAMTLDQLRAKVLALAGATTPVEPTRPPVKVTP